ncbi:MAG TPA: winged helix-turn-helix domain-containing protein [Terriglobales bacterium]|jgi:TolB-like protein/DNA-binding winged helix-turn-helix (wHTH) protein/Tfp pilus assembly protein PilF|nr:winged helix-turn-helix domain-containing protein [Terriglobales bacterium]
MSPQPSELKLLRFGIFEVDPKAGEVRKAGVKQKLAAQPFQVLQALLERPKEVVTRDELRQRIWLDNTFVDYDLALKKAINRVREVLGDSAESPRFIETIPRRGYRFLADVEAVESSHCTPSVWGQNRWGLVAALALVAGAALLLALNAGKLRTLIFAKSRSFEIRSIAVLPLQNLSNDPSQDYFSDGMTEALTTELAQIGSLRVISRTSAMHFKGTRETLPQIGRELNVDAVVEGSAARAGDHIRITAQLIETQTDRHLWAKSYERNVQDVLALQNEVARDIAEEIRIKLTPQEKMLLASGRPVNLEAHEAYLKGRYYLNKRTEEGFRQALAYFSDATQKDGNYALGYAGLADSYVLLGEYSLLPAKEAFPKARDAAAKALERDDTLAEPHNALAAVKEDYDWDWVGAEREFHRAIELNPGYATAHQWYAELLSELGRHKEALAEIRQAQQLDPFSLIINAVYADVLRTAGQDDLAINQLRKTLEIDPNFAHAHFHLGLTLLRKGAFEQAIAEIQTAATLSPNVNDYQGGLGYAYARAGKRAEALNVLERLKEGPKQTYVSWFYVAAIYAGLDEKDQAFACLEKAYEQHEQGFVVMRREPMFDPLLSDPRYQDLLRRLGLPTSAL